MERIAAFLAPNLLLSGAAPSCFADRGIIHVPREGAREWGIEIRLKGNLPSEVWVELELKAHSKRKDFRHVSLEIREGGKPWWATPQFSRSGRVRGVSSFKSWRAATTLRRSP